MRHYYGIANCEQLVKGLHPFGCKPSNGFQGIEPLTRSQTVNSSYSGSGGLDHGRLDSYSDPPTPTHELRLRHRAKQVYKLIVNAVALEMGLGR